MEDTDTVPNTSNKVTKFTDRKSEDQRQNGRAEDMKWP